MGKGEKVKIISPYRDPERADRVLFRFIDLCKVSNVKCYVIYGTLLGLYRDGGYIKGDNDIDVLIQSKEADRVHLVKLMRIKGYEINTIPGAAASMNMHTIIDSIFIDVWHGQRKSFMEFYKGDCRIEYKGISIRVPERIEKYLETVYGNWKIPGKTKANSFGK